MRAHLPLLLLTAFATLAHAQTTKPFATYTLHAQEQPTTPQGRHQIAPNGALIVLLPQKDGNWALKRLTAWSSPTPLEETLTFPGEIPERDKNVYADFRISPDGAYLIARIETVATHLDALNNRKLEALLVVVDLRTFSILARTMESGNPLASGTWDFNTNRLLLAHGVASKDMQPGKTWTSGTTTWEYAAFSSPELRPQAACFYRISNLSRKISDLSETCPLLFDVAHVSSIEELFGPVRTRNEVAAPAPPHCGIRTDSDGDYVASDEESVDKKYVLFNCGIVHNPHSTDGFFTYQTSRSYKVVSVPDGKVVLTLTFSWLKEPSGGMFAQADGKDYFLLFRDGTKLAVYGLP